MKKILAFIVLCVCLTTVCFSAVGCNRGNNKKEVLIVYTEGGFAPWEFSEKGSLDIIGIDIEIAKYIAEKYNYKLNVINGNFDTIVAGIDEDNALGIAAISYNAQRAKAVEYSKMYWGDAFHSIVYKLSDDPVLTDDGTFDTSNFSGAKLVYQTGNTCATLIDDNKDEWGVTATADFTQVMVALEDMKSASGKEFLVVDSQVAAQLAASDDSLGWAAIDGIDAEQYGIVAKKGNTALIEKVNAALDELLEKGEDGKSQIEKWFEQYSAIEPEE